MSNARSSYKRYVRPEKIKGIQPTSDDDKILLEVYRHDVIDAATIYRLFPERSQDRISRRLLLMHHNRYLERLPKIEEIRVEGGGSLPRHYMLGSAGMNRVGEIYKLPPKQKRPQERARRRSGPYIVHDAQASQFVVSLRQSAIVTDGVEFLYPDQIYREYAPYIFESPSLPHVVRAHVYYERHSAVEGTIPDAFGMVRYTNRSEKNRRSLFIEIDMGNATINPTNRYIQTPKFWSGSSILRKFLVYDAYYREGQYKEEFGIPTFQVLTVTTNPDRVKKMQEMWEKRLADRTPPARLLFTDFDTIAKHEGNLMNVPIEQADGKIHLIAP